MPNEEGNQEVVNNEVDQTATAPESTTEETQQPAAEVKPVGRQTESGEIVLDTPEVTEDEDTSESSEDTQTDETEGGEETQKRGAEARKDQLNTEIRDLVSERNQLRQQVEELNAQVYKPASAAELSEQVNPETGDYYTRLEAQVEAMRQEREVEKYNNQIAETQFTIQNEAQRALQDFPMFDQNSPEYDPEAAAEVDAILGQSLVIDPNTGQIVGSHISPYKLYQSHARAAQASARKAQLQGQKNVEKMMASADAVTGGQGKPRTFEQMSLPEKEAYLRKRGHDI